jgi:hypothetical protein
MCGVYFTISRDFSVSVDNGTFTAEIVPAFAMIEKLRAIFMQDKSAILLPN